MVPTCFIIFYVLSFKILKKNHNNFTVWHGCSTMEETTKRRRIKVSNYRNSTLTSFYASSSFIYNPAGNLITCWTVDIYLLFIFPDFYILELSTFTCVPKHQSIICNLLNPQTQFYKYFNKDKFEYTNLWSEAAANQRTDNTMANTGGKRQTMIYKILNIKLKIEQHEPLSSYL